MPKKLISFKDYFEERAKAEMERQLTPDVHVRSQPEIERQPSYFQKTLELEGRSNWSGANWGGRAR
jgi:hypothetical protein